MHIYIYLNEITTDAEINQLHYMYIYVYVYMYVCMYVCMRYETDMGDNKN